MGSNTAFCLVIFGFFGIYCEFIWPGRIVPGICGAAAAVTGGYFLWHALPTVFGLELLGAAAAFFVLDAFANTRFLAGTIATTAQIFGFLKLIPSPRGIRPVLAIPWCIVFGIVTMTLTWAGRRARRNKRSDLAALK